MSRPLLSLVMASAILVFVAATHAADEPALTIGSKAPAIDIEHWLTDRGGTVKPFHAFEPGKVYVVEFFATWCGPCVESMPHLAELQSTRAKDGVTIVSVSDEDVATLRKFLEQPTGEGQATYADVAKAYCLTTDPDGSVQKDYMEAAGQDGIPTAFIVGKTGEIEWIGHPLDMDKPLDEVIAGTWNRAAYRETMRQQEEMEQRLFEVSELLQAGQGEKALAAVDGMIAEAKDDERRAALRALRTRVALRAGGSVAVAALKALADGANVAADDLNEAAWTVFELQSEGKPASADVVAAATRVAEKAVALAPENASALDTLAHFVVLTGDVSKGLAIQRKALAHATPDERPQLEAYLKELEARAAGAGK